MYSGDRYGVHVGWQYLWHRRRRVLIYQQSLPVIGHCRQNRFSVSKQDAASSSVGYLQEPSIAETSPGWRRGGRVFCSNRSSGWLPSDVQTLRGWIRGRRKCCTLIAKQYYDPAGNGLCYDFRGGRSPGDLEGEGTE